METANGKKIEDQVSIEDLPMEFKVKYMGCEISKGLWGIKYVRRPVDIMVSEWKSSTNKSMQPCSMLISTDGVTIHGLSPEIETLVIPDKTYTIDTISYGVQDVVYTKVFAMIVVKDDKNTDPFEVHAFVCDSRPTARRLTFALAAAFQDYARRVKENGDDSSKDTITPTRQKFAIDLRTPEDFEDGIEEETEA